MTRANGSVGVVGLDGDDTLWHSERLFVETQDRFCELLAPHADLDATQLAERLLDVQRRNLGPFGYGVKAYTLSLIETAIEVTDGAVPASAIQSIIDLGRVLLDHPVHLLEGAYEAVDALTDRHRVLLLTKGDLLHQESKVARSGLADLFWAIEIVSEKDEATYRHTLARLGVDPTELVMVGNSVRSDVLPPIEIGARAVHVPYQVTWALEHADAQPDRHRFPVLGSIAELPACIAELDAQPWPS